MDVTLSSPPNEGSARPTFFDDRNKIALYIIVPSCILVYGGCCLIYSIAKLRRYLHRIAKQQKEENAKQETDHCSEMEHAKDAIGNIAIIDLTEL